MREYVKKIIPTARGPLQSQSSECFAPTNFALIKYWGKRNPALNLPVTGSLSATIPTKGTHTTISITEQSCDHDSLVYNDNPFPSTSLFHTRTMDFLDLFRPHGNMAFHVETRSNIAIDAGLASSASGFAALVMALNDLFGWALSRSQQSLLARLGSGSACRSFWPGFVEWDCGAQTDGQDSYAHPLKRTWEGLCLGICLTSTEKKAICSREAMNITVNTSSLYKSWPARVTEDMSALKKAIETKDFARFGEVAEENALAMHATMLDASPSINYTLEATHALQRAVWAARKNGLAVYFTQDAGPNLKLLYMEKDSAAVKDLFPEVQSHRLF